MIYDLQKASLLKRFSAFLLDIILVATIAAGFAFALSAITGYDTYSDAIDQGLAEYEEKYGIKIDIDAETYEKFTDAERENYDNAQKAMSEDKALQKNYAMVFSLSLVILSISIFLAIFSAEFLIPLWLGNGQTVGKKVFGICLMRIDGVRVSRLSLFARAVLGKYTIETMIPILILMMFMFGVIGFVGTVVLLMLLGLQIGVMIYTNTNSMIHDLFASTVVVDMASQMIFDSPEALLAYKEKVAAEYAEHHER